jgi:hypothetical protein
MSWWGAHWRLSLLRLHFLKHNLCQEHFYPWGKEKRGVMKTYLHVADISGISKCGTSVSVTGFGDDSPPALFAETFQKDLLCL